MNPNDFKTRTLNRIPKEEWDRIRKNGLLESNEHGLADDWVMVVSESANDVKYGRLMYSPTLDKFRGQTMGEFYGSGIVD